MLFVEYCVMLYGLCFVLLCLSVFSLRILMRFVCGALCDAIGGVRVILCGSYV